MLFEAYLNRLESRFGEEMTLYIFQNGATVRCSTHNSDVSAFCSIKVYYNWSNTLSLRLLS